MDKNLSVTKDIQSAVQQCMVFIYTHSSFNTEKVLGIGVNHTQNYRFPTGSNIFLAFPFLYLKINY